ncbi:MAG: VTT domain-containing protein [Desulfurococcales archaeon]|nr:VTT domain-containing protein [Desulfurococcales archaeon]
MNDSVPGAQIAAESQLSEWIVVLQDYGLPGIFLAAFFSNLIPGFPAVYLVFIATYSALVPGLVYNVGVIVAAGVGAALGKLVVFYASSFLATRFGRVRKRREMSQKVLKRAGKGLAITVFVFAALPLPDDVLYIPLGVAGFSALYFFVAVVLGKIVLTAIVSFLGGFYKTVVSWLIGDTAVSTGSTLVLFVVGAVIAALIITAITLSIDWRGIAIAYQQEGFLGGTKTLLKELILTIIKPFRLIYRYARGAPSRRDEVKGSSDERVDEGSTA